MKSSKTIAIGVMPQAKLLERVLAIARGDYMPNLQVALLLRAEQSATEAQT
jgi:hypothetical protein